MQENTDVFEKLNNHHLPIDESYWAEMEERLQNDRKKTVPFWAWIAGTGIAASLALLVAVQVFNTDNVGTQISADTDFLERTQITQISANNIENEQVVEVQITDNTLYKNLRKSVLSAFQKDTPPAHEDYEVTNNNTSIDIAQIEQDTILKKQYELKFEYDDWLLAQNEPKKRKSQNKNSWQIAAAFSSSASNSSNGDLAFLKNGDRDNGFWASPPNHEMPSLNNTDSRSIDEVFQSFPEATHLPPLSVGLTVRKNLNKHLAFETGLTYTFLRSKFKDDGEWQWREATLKLHYLGIPLNAVAYLINKPQWNVYFSLGGMVEKGIMFDYVQHTQNRYPPHWWWMNENQPIHTVSLQDDIPDLQWSINTSFGVGYKFYRDISIYFEPRIIYYFKNNQPASVRTESPLLVGLNAGLRFEF